MKPLVVLEHALLDSMARDSRFSAFETCLVGVRTARRSGCGRCGRKASNTAAAYQGAKQCIAGLNDTQKGELKKLLNAKKVRVVIAQSGNKHVQITF